MSIFTWLLSALVRHVDEYVLVSRSTVRVNGNCYCARMCVIICDVRGRATLDAMCLDVGRRVQCEVVDEVVGTRGKVCLD